MAKTRANSAFGIHFDFHARPGMTVADIYRPDICAKMLDEVKPDYMQVDTKGHAGLSSYPTKVGYQADKIEYDILRMWRDLTAERGIALYGHHSGLFDQRVAKEHPDWAIVGEDGTVSTGFISMFSPYCDEILIPQLKELASYGLDGAWVDGECWGAGADWSPAAVHAYKAATGKDAPKSDDPEIVHYFDFLRQRFRDYVTHYVTEVKKEYPDFQITSNWIYSAYMPEKMTVPVDYLSGDYSSQNSVNSVRYLGRIFAAHDHPWDLMAWGQNTVPCNWTTLNRQNKDTVQLCQEAAANIVLGGGFEFFDILYGNGSLVQEWCIDTWKQVGEFVRAREPWNFQSKAVPEIAVIYHKNYSTLKGTSLFNASCPCGQAWTNALQNAGFSSQVLFDDSLEKLADYKVVVFPEAPDAPASLVEAVKDYVRNGGKVIVDLQAAKYFSDIFQLPAPIETELVFADGDGRLASILTDYCDTEPEADDLVYYHANYYQATPYAACKKVSYGNGSFLFQMFSVGPQYKDNQSAPMHTYLRNLLKRADFTPLARASSSYVDVVCATKDGKLLVNLLNTAGPHAVTQCRSFNEIPPLYNVTVEIQLSQAPRSVMLEPEHKPCPYTYNGKTLTLTVERLDIHSILVIE